MRREMPSRYETVNSADESFRAFIPLPPSPPLSTDSELLHLLADAMLALGRLDTASSQLPDQSLLIYSYIRKEAVLSSQIEGTQSSISDLLRYELTGMPGGLRDDVVEVSNYVAAMNHGLQRLGEDFPLSNRLLRELHEKLLSNGRGSDKTPGEFRRSQVWIGSSRPSDANFVPPPHIYIDDSMGELELFLHAKDDGIPPLVRAGLAHVQFETIHPFLDGNGRIGRLLITFMLCSAGILRHPTLYLSLYFKRHRSRYYELLNEVRATGDWEAWLRFFLTGVRDTAENAYTTSQRIFNLFEEHGASIEQIGTRRGSVARAHEALKKMPIASIAELSKLADITYPTVSSAIETMVEMGIAQEVTGGRTNRLFVYDRYIAILNEGTEIE